MGLPVPHLRSVLGETENRNEGADILTSLFRSPLYTGMDISSERDAKEGKLLLTTLKDFYSSSQFLFYKK